MDGEAITIVLVDGRRSRGDIAAEIECFNHLIGNESRPVGPAMKLTHVWTRPGADPQARAAALAIWPIEVWPKFCERYGLAE